MKTRTPEGPAHPLTNHVFPTLSADSEFAALSVIPLGGACEIGKNMTVYEQGSEILVVDCGLMFPGDEQLGVDVVIPDISYLLTHRDKVRGIALTHGHEDHIGALPYVLAQLNVPIYGTRLTLGLVRAKLEEYDMWKDVEAHEVEDGGTISIGGFDVQFVHVTHSIPDACSLVISTRLGKVVHTSDFKFDPEPVDERTTDEEALRQAGDEGVLALVCDTTNAIRPGRTRSESTIEPVLDGIFAAAGGRIIIATFASNLNRIRLIIRLAEKHGRKVGLAGRSIEQNVKMARQMEYIQADPETIVSLGQLDQYEPSEVCVITTGTQGEPLSALARMATEEHRKIRIDPGDTVILSSTPIPGNEDAVYRVVNNLYRQGADVIYEEINPGVHVSGHGSADELRHMVELTRPRYVVPVHGEHRHVVTFGRMVREMGYAPEDVLTAEVGEIIEFTDEGAGVVGAVPSSGSVMVDGIGVGDVGEVVLRDRRHLADEGVVFVSLTLNRNTGEVLAGPDFVSRGFVQEADEAELYEKARDVVLRELAAIAPDYTGEWTVVKTDLRRALNKFFQAEIRRRPMVLPVIVEV